MTTTARPERSATRAAPPIESATVPSNGTEFTNGKTDYGRNGHEEPSPIEWLVVDLPLTDIRPNPSQPRIKFRKLDMATLVRSVRLHGVLQPVTVRSENGHYVLVAGERRWRASAQAGRETVPAIIRDDLTDEAAAELALVENLQRHDLSIMEEAVGYSLLVTQFSLTPERIAERVGRSIVSVKNTLKLLLLPQSVQQLLASGKLTQSHGIALLRFRAFPEICLAIADYCVDEGLPVVYMERQIPNVEELEENGLIVTLRQFQTAFDIAATCSKCPFQAFRQEGNSLYCLKPEEWGRKQREAQRQLRDEAARVLQQARDAGEKAVDVSKLGHGAYRDLSLSYSRPPLGCNEQCPCRASALLNGKMVPICLDTERVNRLRQEEEKQARDLRIHRVDALYGKALEVIEEEARRGRFRRVAVILARTILLSSNKAIVIKAASTVFPRLHAESLFSRQVTDVEKAAILATVPWTKLMALMALILATNDANEAIRSENHTPLVLNSLLDRLHPPQQEMELPEASDEETEEDRYPHSEEDAKPAEELAA